MFTCSLTTSHPRASGPAGIQTIRPFTDCYESTPPTSHRGCATGGTAEPVGIDGWKGSYTGVEDGAGQRMAHGIYAGTGTNAGLTLLTFVAWSDTDPITLSGIIYEGQPPLPDPTGGVAD